MTVQTSGGGGVGTATLDGNEIFFDAVDELVLVGDELAAAATTGTLLLLWFLFFVPAAL